MLTKAAASSTTNHFSDGECLFKKYGVNNVTVQTAKKYRVSNVTVDIAKKWVNNVTLNTAKKYGVSIIKIGTGKELYILKVTGKHVFFFIYWSTFFQEYADLHPALVWSNQVDIFSQKSLTVLDMQKVTVAMTTLMGDQLEMMLAHLTTSLWFLVPQWFHVGHVSELPSTHSHQGSKSQSTFQQRLLSCLVLRYGCHPNSRTLHSFHCIFYLKENLQFY